MFIYEIQAFAYSDFEHHILVHEKKFTQIEFRKMIEIARQKAAKKAEEDDEYYWNYNYPDNFIKVLKDDFGFKSPEYLIGYVGCNFDDAVEMILHE